MTVLDRLAALEQQSQATDCAGAWRTTGKTGSLPTSPAERAYVIQFLLSCADVEELDGGPGREHRAEYWRRLVTLAASGDDDASAQLAKLLPHLPTQHGISSELLDHI